MLKIAKVFALLAGVFFFFSCLPPTGAATIQDAYTKLKQNPEYGKFITDLTSTGKVTEGEIDAFVRELSSQLPADLTRENYEEEFKSAAITLFLDERYKNLLAAMAEVFAADWELIKDGRLPVSLQGVQDALERELFDEEEGQPTGGGGGGSGGSSTKEDESLLKAFPAEEASPAKQPAEQPASSPLPAKTFADLAGHWAQKDVEIMASRHVARGVSETEFAPDADVTRAQFAALLIRTLGIDEAAPTGTIFSDVPKDAWYAGAVETAYAHQLVSGMGGGLFAPDEKITREQMAAMIIRALKAAGKPITLTQTQLAEVLKAYADQAEISSWATRAMAEAVSTGIVKGRTATTLAPQGTATRAEAVVMLKRLIDSVGIY